MNLLKEGKGISSPYLSLLPLLCLMFHSLGYCPPPPQIFFSCHPDTQNTLYIVAITSQKQCYFWCSLVGEYTHTQCERDRSVSSQSQKPPKRAVVHQQGRKTSLASQVFGYIRKKLIVGVQHTVNSTILACKTTGALKLGFFTL